MAIRSLAAVMNQVEPSSRWAIREPLAALSPSVVQFCADGVVKVGGVGVGVAVADGDVAWP